MKGWLCYAFSDYGYKQAENYVAYDADDIKKKK